MTREQFRQEVFERDNYKCVICGSKAKDAHHIIERRLWDDGGYYIDNGASLCEVHHIEAEKTILSCDEIRKAAKINRVILPEHLYNDQVYDKWGNIILSDGRRIKGELANDSVKKILSSSGVEFSSYVKYPRTYHLPWSLGIGKDDRVLKSVSQFENKKVVVSIKMDGENTSLYRDYFHARSLDGEHHPSQSWLRRFQSEFMHEIPDGWRICGENLYAKHTIQYKKLETYFMVFSIWNENNDCLSFDDMLIWCELLNLKTVPIIYYGIWDEKVIRNLKVDCEDNWEGYVVRNANIFPYSAFRHNVAKFVKTEFKDHIDSHHWKSRSVIPNELKNLTV